MHFKTRLNKGEAEPLHSTKLRDPRAWGRPSILRTSPPHRDPPPHGPLPQLCRQTCLPRGCRAQSSLRGTVGGRGTAHLMLRPPGPAPRKTPSKRHINAKPQEQTLEERPVQALPNHCWGSREPSVPGTGPRAQNWQPRVARSASLRARLCTRTHTCTCTGPAETQQNQSSRHHLPPSQPV